MFTQAGRAHRWSEPDTRRRWRDDVTSCPACRCLFVDVMTAGRVIGDRYEVGGLLGRGGAASVWLARDCWLDRSVAIKELTGRWLQEPKALERFDLEARTVGG